MSSAIGLRDGLDLALLWPAAVALIRPLAWGLPYIGEALKRKKKKKKKRNLAICANHTTSLFIYLFLLFRAAPVAYGSSQVRGQIGAAVAS